MTEKVRIKSIAEMGRLAVVQANDREDEENDDEMDLDGDGIDDDSDDSAEGVAVDRYPEGLGKWEMEAGRVYERTIDLLGGELGNCELVS
jgi:Subunit 11 of the general transcription factor TFIIH